MLNKLMMARLFIVTSSLSSDPRLSRIPQAKSLVTVVPSLIPRVKPPPGSGIENVVASAQVRRVIVTWSGCAGVNIHTLLHHLPDIHTNDKLSGFSPGKRLRPAAVLRPKRGQDRPGIPTQALEPAATPGQHDRGGSGAGRWSMNDLQMMTCSDRLYPAPTYLMSAAHPPIRWRGPGSSGRGGTSSRGRRRA